MRTLGLWSLVFGALALVLPRFGYDLEWFESLGRAREPVAAGLLVLGGVLLVFAARSKKKPS